MITITYQNSLAADGKTWTYEDTTDYSAVVLTSIQLKIWDPSQDPSTDTPVIDAAVPILTPNASIEYDPTDFGKASDDVKLDDGIYTIDLVVTSDDADSPQTQRGYYYNVHNIKLCIKQKTEDAEDKDCDCKDKDFAFIARMRAILDGSCFNYNQENFTTTKSQLATLQNLCSESSDCGC